jgi:hypothetical protein
MNDLERRIDRLESLESLRALKHTYCKYCDEGYAPERIASLFWDDAVWDAGPAFGRYEGPAAIQRFFAGVSSAIVWARHFVVNERLEVDGEDGDSGRGEFQIIQPMTVRREDGGAQAQWLIGQYTETYARRGGVWKYQSLRADIAFMVPYADGWAEVTAPDGD